MESLAHLLKLGQGSPLWFDVLKLIGAGVLSGVLFLVIIGAVALLFGVLHGHAGKTRENIQKRFSGKRWFDILRLILKVLVAALSFGALGLFFGLIIAPAIAGNDPIREIRWAVGITIAVALVCAALYYGIIKKHMMPMS